MKGQFHEYQESTIGAAFLTQTVHIEETAVKFEIWVSQIHANKHYFRLDFFSCIFLNNDDVLHFVFRPYHMKNMI